MPTAKKTVKVQKPKVTVKKAPVVKKAVAKTIAPKETGLRQHVYDPKGKVVGSTTLPAEIFGAKINRTLMTQAVRVYLANQRRGTSSTKSRGEVKISTRKIYRQKGTGRARHGAASAPIFVGGGIAFGPKPRDFSLKLNQNMRRVALFSALSAKLKDGEIKIVTGLEKIEPKTRKMAEAIKKLELNGRNSQVLLIIPSGNQFNNVIKAGRNIKGVTVNSAGLINTYEVLANKRILFMKGAIDSLKETFLK
ncbi:MAG: 50S ribosomal protein L4 [Candidatus Levyibacteriota bacterium]|jgi:large subunit ribosomal protein L4